MKEERVGERLTAPELTLTEETEPLRREELLEFELWWEWVEEEERELAFAVASSSLTRAARVMFLGRWEGSRISFE